MRNARRSCEATGPYASLVAFLGVSIKRGRRPICLTLLLILIAGAKDGLCVTLETSIGQTILVQTGAFKRAAGVSSLVAELSEKGYVAHAISGDDSHHRVVVGPLLEEREAAAVLSRLQRDGYSAYIRRDLPFLQPTAVKLGESDLPLITDPSAGLSRLSLPQSLSLLTENRVLMMPSFRLVSLQAQPSAALYTISGVVLDPSGAFVPGASVRLHQQEVTISHARTQDADGRFSFRDVPPGVYTVQVQVDEFELHEVSVRIDDTDPKPLSIVLVLKELQQDLTVYDSENEVNTSIPQNSSAMTLDLDILEGIPMMDDDIISAVRNLVENISGEAASIVVDGLPASDSNISPAEIKEIKINKDPYSAEYSRPGSGRIEITTKGGSKSFHGSIRFGLRDYRMDARNAFALDRPTTQRRVYSGDFSGPLSKSGKTTFIATVWRNEDDQRSIVNGDIVKCCGRGGSGGALFDQFSILEFLSC